MARDATSYACVRCGAALAADESSLRCERCTRVYPQIDGVPILTARPHALLCSHARRVRQYRERLDGLRRAAQSGLRRPRGARLMRMLRGIAANARLIETCMAPVTEYLRRAGECRADLLGWALTQDWGHPAHRMLSYFAQDWTRGADVSAMEELICGAAARHAPNRARVVILGCGAGAIARACAARFDEALGIDLSISTILLARKLQSGAPMEIFLDRAGWRPVELVPEIAPAHASFAVADAAALPFERASVSTVITQYLMDAIPHPLGVIAEIERVLMPAGVWINFSRPLRIPGEPQDIAAPDFTDVRALLQEHGLRILEAQRTRAPFLKLEHLFDAGDKLDQEVCFTVAQKAPGAAAARAMRPRAARPEADRDFWRSVPMMVPGRRPQLIQRRTAGSATASCECEIYCAGMRVAASEAECAFVDALVGAIDGRSTVDEIHARLASRKMPVCRTDLAELIVCLTNQYGMLTGVAPARSECGPARIQFSSDAHPTVAMARCS